MTYMYTIMYMYMYKLKKNKNFDLVHCVISHPAFDEN